MKLFLPHKNLRFAHDLRTELWMVIIEAPETVLGRAIKFKGRFARDRATAYWQDHGGRLYHTELP